MKRVLAILFVFSVALTAAAQTVPKTPKTDANTGPLRERWQASYKVDFATIDNERKQAVAQRAADFQSALDLQKIQFQSTLAAQQADFQGRLANLQNTRGTQIVERIANRFQQISTREVDFGQNFLDRLDGILARIKSRRDKAAINGQDVKVADDAITYADQTIASTRAIVLDYAGKSFGVTVTNDDTMKADAQAAEYNFTAELKKVQDALKNAKNYVQTANNALKLMSDIDRYEAVPSTSRVAPSIAPPTGEQTGT